MVEEETSGNNFILLEETLQNAIEKKKKLSKSSLSQDVIIEQEDGVNLNQEQLDLLERFRRESDTIPYFGSFFPNLDKEAKRRASYDTENEKSNKFEKNKKITNRRKSHAVAIPTHPEADQDKTRSRSLTSSFLSNYFLNHSKKNNSSEFAETEDENSSSILFKIPIVGSRLEARRKSQISQVDELSRRASQINIDLNEIVFDTEEEPQNSKIINRPDSSSDPITRL